MNKQKFLSELEKELNIRDIDGVDEILADYLEHFEYKEADGYSELEICAKLAPPHIIAAQYGESAVEEKKLKPLNVAGLACMGLLALPIFAFLFGWVAVLGASALSCFGLSLGLIFDFNLGGVIPYIPYFGSLVLGISVLALSILAAAGTIYCCLYFVKLLKTYIKWNEFVAYGTKNRNYPLIVVYTTKNKKFKRHMRRITQTSLTVFAVAFLLGFIVLVIHARSFEFWHVYNWFVD